MTTRWQEEGVPYRAAKTAFGLLLQADSLTRPDRSASRRVSPADLAAYIADPTCQGAEEISAALRADARLLDDFQHLLRRLSVTALPRMAAASSGVVTRREADGCRITLKPSRANSSQLYVLIEFADLDRVPTALFALSAQGRHMRHPLPPAEAGRLQLLVDADSELVSYLCDVDAEVFLQ